MVVRYIGPAGRSKANGAELGTGAGIDPEEAPDTGVAAGVGAEERAGGLGDAGADREVPLGRPEVTAGSGRE